MDRCLKCGEPLGYCKIIYAAAGGLYCSEKCGCEDLSRFPDFPDFSELVEEITPSSIGIMPHRNYKITGVDAKGKRFKPIYTNFPRHFNIFRGTVWRLLPDGKRKKEYDVIN